MAKKIDRKKIKSTLDPYTGELMTISEETVVGMVDQEPEYIKIYIGTQLYLNELDPSLAPYIIAFAPYMSYANAQEKHVVQTTELQRQAVAKKLGVTDKRVQQIIKLLVDSGIFIPIYKTEQTVDAQGNMIEKQTKRRGVYFVNPFYAAKGAWKDIKELRQNIDYIKGVSSVSISDGEDATPRQITGQVAALEDSTGQMTFRTIDDFNAISERCKNNG